MDEKIYKIRTLYTGKCQECGTKLSVASDGFTDSTKSVGDAIECSCWECCTVFELKLVHAVLRLN